MELKTTYDGPPVTERVEEEEAIKLYYNGQEMKKFDPTPMTVINGEPIIIDIHNNSTADLIDIRIKANYPIESADGPHTILAGGRGQISIKIDTDKLMWLDSNGEMAHTEIGYTLCKTFGAPQT